MKRLQRESESRLVERLMNYRDEYHTRRAAEIDEERVRRHACGEVCIADCWVLRTDAERVVRGLQRHELLNFVEIIVLLVLLVAVAAGFWWLFKFLFLP